MIYTSRASLLSSTRKLGNSFRASYGSLRNPNYGNPVVSSSDHTGNVNGFNVGDQFLGGFQQNSYAQSLNGFVSDQNPNGFYQNCSKGYNQDRSVSFGESSRIFNQLDASSQSWDCYTGGQSSNANDLQVQSHDEGIALGTNHFQQERSSGTNGSLEELDRICREGKVRNAVEIIKSWRNDGYVVDLPRLLWLAQLCGDAQALEEAKVVHEFIISSVSLSDIRVYNSIIEMYSGCGSVEDALTVFNSMSEKNLETWCAIIRCFAMNGQGEDAIDMFSRFKEEGNSPDGEIFKEIFFACGVLGDIDEGVLHFDSMIKDYEIIPCMEHYASLVRMLAELGYVDEALRIVESVEPNVDLWVTLMNLSRVHGDLELGDRCQDMVEQLDASRLDSESKAGLVPVSLADIAKEKLQRMAQGKNFGGESLVAEDTCLPEKKEIHIALQSLKEHITEIGYVPESKLELHDVDQDSKDENLLNHSMKFAFIKAMLDTRVRSTITVMKDFRVCVDCHNALKMMSKIVGRELITRDASRFHHMKDGVCSCKDYW